MRLEVLITLVLGIAFIASWLFIPIWALEGLNYSMRLMPWGGFITTLFSESSLIPLPLTWGGAVAFTLASAITPPIIHRRTVYSLYLSLVFLVIATTLLIATFIFQERYLVFRGYTITPTPNGYDYVLIPYKTVWGLPLYLLLIFMALTIVNAVTRARWLNLQVIIMVKHRHVINEDPLITIKRVLSSVSVHYVEEDGSLGVGGTRVLMNDGRLVLIRTNGKSIERREVNIEDAIAELIRVGLRNSLMIPPGN